jgi:hypothetical protein
MAKRNKTAALKKPVKKQSDPYWDFHEVMHYLEKLHGRNFRDYAGKFGADAGEEERPYQDFWHWIIDQNEISNGCWMHLPDWEYYMVTDAANTEPWKKEIMQYFKDFLGNDYHERLWVEW